MSSGEEAIRKDGVGAELTEDGAVKPPSSDENLPKVADSESQVEPKVESEAIGKAEDLGKEKSGEKDEISKICSSIVSEMKILSVVDDGKNLSKSEDKQTGDDKSSLKDGSEGSLQSSEGNLPKEDGSESKVAPKVESGAIGKAEDLENVKSGEKDEEVSKQYSSVISEKKESNVVDDGKSASKSEDKQTGDNRSSLTAGSESSLQSSEEKSGPYESPRGSLQSSDGKSGSYASALGSCPFLGKNPSDGYVKMGLVRSTIPAKEDDKKDESGSIPSGENKPSVDESSKSAAVGSAEIQSEVSTEKTSVDENEGNVEDSGDPRPVAAEDGSGPSQKRKAAQSGTPKKWDFFGMNFSSKSSDKPKTPKKSSASDKIKSPKSSDGQSDKPETPKKSDDPNETLEKAKSPRKFNILIKMTKVSRKSSDGADGSADKIKSPDKCNTIDEPLKKSKKSDGPEKVKSPKKSSGPKLLEKPKGSKKCGEWKESTTDSPIKQSKSQIFRDEVSKFMQRLSPGESKELKARKRPVLSSSCNPDLYVNSPELSPISHIRHFSAAFLGSLIFPTDLQADRIDYSKLAEDRIIATFLTSHECYDVMPISGKVIVLSVDLLVKNAFSALVTNEINAAPLWDSALHDFVGFLTITDFINVLRHYFYSSPEDIKDIENQSISTWRRITKVPNRFVKINGSNNLSEAAKLLVQDGVHRIPVFDERRQCVLFVLTRKRLLQYLSFNLLDKLEQFSIKAPSFFKKPLKEVGVGTYENIATVTESTKVIDALDLFVNRGVSSLPVVDDKGELKDIFGKMDVFALAKEQMYHNLEITVFEVIRKGVLRECAVICTLEESLGAVIQRFISTKSHRMVVIDGYKSVVGIVSLSDLLKFLVVEPLAAIALEAAAGSASDIIEEGVEGAVGGAEGDSVFNDNSENVSGESSKEESCLALNSMKDLNISKDNEEDPVAEDVSKSE